jgi:hypothetical protein
MSLAMVIAPGTSMDRKWHDAGYVLRFVDPEPVEWIPTVDALAEAPAIRTATRRRFWHPAWAVLLEFYVDDRLGRLLPAGYVLPGSIYGTVPESEPIR